jgi:ubiquinone/menaquinone biosynthesis C-methylase UbiE
LATLPEFAARLQQDVLALDAATVALARRLGESAVEVWPESAAASFFEAGPPPDGESVRFVASRAAVVVSSSYDLTAWLENPEGFDPGEELERSTRHWLISFPAPDAAPAYAELSERTARAFNLLSAPKSAAQVSSALDGLSAAEVLEVIGGLAEIGVIERAAERQALPNDAFVMLDPAVEILDGEVAGYRLLCHHHFEVGMAMPPGEGLSAIVNALTGKPVSVGVLRESFADRVLLEKMLASLRLRGFLHRTSQAILSVEELTQARSAAEEMLEKRLRRPVVIDLDAPMSMERLRAQLDGGEAGQEVLLRCARLAEHEATLAELARLRGAGTLRLHHTVLQTADPACDRDICRSLIRLGAPVIVEGVRWPAPSEPIPGLAELTRNCVAVHALMTPDLSILDETVRARALAWGGSAFISGLCLRLEADALWPAADATEEAFIAVFDAVRELEDEFGDIRIVNLPADEVLLGNTASRSGPERLSDFANRFRMTYLRRRLPFLKSLEGDNTWSQTPEAEEKVVRAQEDFLPNHPELLLLGPGSVVVDVCGGLGRVARRLAPAVGQDGLIVSFEMLRCLSDRARQLAGERNTTNAHFRPGLAQRIPLPDGAADAAVNEWTGAIWELGLGPAMVNEMLRVVRPGGRIAVTHRLARFPLSRLGQPWVQYEDIYRWMRSAFVHPKATVIAERVWGQTVPSLVGENATEWRKQYLPRVVDPFDVVYEREDSPGPHADIYLTIIAERQ